MKKTSLQQFVLGFFAVTVVATCMCVFGCDRAYARPTTEQYAEMDSVMHICRVCNDTYDVFEGDLIDEDCPDEVQAFFEAYDNGDYDIWSKHWTNTIRPWLVAYLKQMSTDSDEIAADNILAKYFHVHVCH